MGKSSTCRPTAALAGAAAAGPAVGVAVAGAESNDRAKQDRGLPKVAAVGLHRSLEQPPVRRRRREPALQKLTGHGVTNGLESSAAAAAADAEAGVGAPLKGEVRKIWLKRPLRQTRGHWQRAQRRQRAATARADPNRAPENRPRQPVWIRKPLGRGPKNLPQSCSVTWESRLPCRRESKTEAAFPWQSLQKRVAPY